jgi:hypothetical protein
MISQQSIRTKNVLNSMRLIVKVVDMVTIDKHEVIESRGIQNMPLSSLFTHKFRFHVITIVQSRSYISNVVQLDLNLCATWNRGHINF